MPQRGPKGFRFSDLSMEHQKAVQWYMKKNRSNKGGIKDTRCRSETRQFLRCIQKSNYDQTQCGKEIMALQSCIDTMEADPVCSSDNIALTICIMMFPSLTVCYCRIIHKEWIKLLTLSGKMFEGH